MAILPISSTEEAPQNGHGSMDVIVDALPCNVIRDFANVDGKLGEKRRSLCNERTVTPPPDVHASNIVSRTFIHRPCLS
jgi:hypothetical protein